MYSQISLKDLINDDLKDTGFSSIDEESNSGIMPLVNNFWAKLWQNQEDKDKWVLSVYDGDSTRVANFALLTPEANLDPDSDFDVIAALFLDEVTEAKAEAVTISKLLSLDDYPLGALNF